MLVTLSVQNHLRKYFYLACRHYEESDWGLSVFFAVTVIEECAKILCLRDADLKDEKQKRDILSHEAKHLDALFNLLSGSDRFDALPKRLQDHAWAWLSSGKLMKLRNRSLYIWFSNNKELKVPDEIVSAKEAAILIYLSGFSAVELAEYVDLDSKWVDNLSQDIETFRQKHIVLEEQNP